MSLTATVGRNPDSPTSNDAQTAEAKRRTNGYQNLDPKAPETVTIKTDVAEGLINPGRSIHDVAALRGAAAASMIKTMNPGIGGAALAQAEAIAMELAKYSARGQEGSGEQVAERGQKRKGNSPQGQQMPQAEQIAVGEEMEIPEAQAIPVDNRQKIAQGIGDALAQDATQGNKQDVKQRIGQAIPIEQGIADGVSEEIAQAMPVNGKIDASQKISPAAARALVATLLPAEQQEVALAQRLGINVGHVVVNGLMPAPTVDAFRTEVSADVDGMRARYQKELQDRTESLPA